MNNSIVETSIWLSCISFFAFFVSSCVTYYLQISAAQAAKEAATVANNTAQKATGGGAGQAQNAPLPTDATISNLSDLFKQITGALEVIVKAGPGLAGLLASILFLAVGCWASVKSDKPEQQTCMIDKETILSIKDNKVVDPVAIVCKNPISQK